MLSPSVDLALTRPAGPRSGTSTRISEGQGLSNLTDPNPGPDPQNLRFTYLGHA
jgi:hypothetical protein